MGGGAGEGMTVSRVYFSTNREPRPRKAPRTFGSRLHGDSPATLRFGWATVEGRVVRVMVEPEVLVKERSGWELDQGASVLGSRTVLSAVRAEMSELDRDALVYVHGFNVGFKEGIRSADRLRRALGANAPLLALFSWPSDGAMTPWLAYASDRRDAAASGPALGRALLKLVEFLRSASAVSSCDRRVHLLAHSMGVYVLRHALQTVIAERPGVLPRIFDQVLLVAADEDEDAFEHDSKLRRLPELGRRVSVYFNRDDTAMMISDRTKGHLPRLGEDGLRLPAQTPSRVTQVDCTPVVAGLVEHGYHLRTEAVVADFRAVLLGTDPSEILHRRYSAARNCHLLVDRKAASST